MSKTEAISLYQPLLYAIAFKIIGRVEDAQDIVQDTFEKWLSIDHAKIENTKAYLIQAVKNNSIQYVQSWKKRVFSAEIEEKSESVEDTTATSSFFNFDMEAQMTQAWAVIQHKLEPLEKSIYVLREIFNVEYHELQVLFGKKADHLRKLVSRARQKVNDEKNVSIKELPATQLPDSFKKAFTLGNLSEMISDFQKEVTNKFSSKK